MDRAWRGARPSIGAALVLVLLVVACGGNARAPLREVPVVFGDTPAQNANALVGVWHTEDLRITSSGRISGRLELETDGPTWWPVYKEVLFLQVWAVYIWPQYGDRTSRPAGEFIPVFASHSTETSATFDVNARFEVPEPQIDMDGGMLLYTLEITGVWYRVWSSTSHFVAKLGYPVDPEGGWRGELLIDRSPTPLQGTLDINVRGQLPYAEWLRTNVAAPTDVPRTDVPRTDLSAVNPATPPVFSSPLGR